MPPLISEYICHHCQSPISSPWEDTEVLPCTFQHTLSPRVECPRGQVQGAWPPSSRRPWLVAWLGSHSLPCGWVEALGRVWCQSRAAVRATGGQVGLAQPTCLSQGSHWHRLQSNGSAALGPTSRSQSAAYSLTHQDICWLSAQPGFSIPWGPTCTCLACPTRCLNLLLEPWTECGCLVGLLSGRLLVRQPVQALAPWALPAPSSALQG